MYQLIDIFRHLDPLLVTIGKVNEFDQLKLNVTVEQKPLFVM